MTVFLLKSKSGEPDPYECEFHDAEFVPIMNCEYHTHVVEECLHKINDVDGLIVTSQRAVDTLQQALANSATKPMQFNYNIPVFTVGPATAARLREYKFTNVIGEHTGNGAELSKLMLNMDLKGKKLMFLAGEIHRPLLPQSLNDNGVYVNTIVVYRTTPMLTSFKANANDWVVFFSPSHTDCVLKYIRELPFKVKIGAIGPTTQTFLESNGIHVDAMADKPTPKSLHECINCRDLNQ